MARTGWLVLAALALVGCNQTHYGRPDAVLAGPSAAPLNSTVVPTAPQLLIRFKPGLRDHQRNAFRSQFNLVSLGYMKQLDTYVEALPSGGDATKAIAKLRAHPWVSFVDLNAQAKPLS